jgi:ATP-dependent helicase/nuclease subunit B
MQSLRALPLWQAWQDDAAGVVLIRQIEELHAALQRQKPRLDWAEFRRMLERLLESATFIPQPAESPVRLLTLEQAQGLRCDFLIIAGASAAQFPGKPAAEVVFNHSVRAELGLPHWNEQLTRQLARFRSLLHAAPQIFVTYAAEDEDEAAEPCPWVEALRVVGLATPDLDLPRLAASAAIEVATAETELPGHQPAPRPPAPAALIPASLSAGAHQALIDCPYKFFASACLGLRAAEEPDEPVSRRDFGERVHLILQAFHEQVAGLPPAFAGAVTAERRVEALEKLQAITLAVLRDDLRNRALAQVWLAEIQTLIPELVNWLIARSADWPRVETEAALERALTPELKLHGRVDRLEHNPAGDCSVVDYKTGEAPRTSDVEDGEAIQATHYALLAQPCTRVEYLLLGGDRKPVPAIEGDALAAASTGVRERLKQIFVELRLGAPLPAQGDELTCSRCDFSGLCRVGTWHE